MKLLFDTHAFIWWDSDPSKLPPNVLALCRDRNNQIILSVASAWEMQIKIQLGKLKLNIPLADVIENQQNTNGIELLPVTLSRVLALDSLPYHHKDPFDRLLIAQTISEGALLISGDSVFVNYSIQLVWQ